MGELIVVLFYLVCISLFIAYIDSDFFAGLPRLLKFFSIIIIVALVLASIIGITGFTFVSVETIFGTICIPYFLLCVFGILSPFAIVFYLAPIWAAIYIVKFIMKFIKK